MLTAAEYVALIAGASQAGAKELVLGDLKVKFGDEPQPPATPNVIPLPVTDPTELDDADEQAAKEQRANELLIADPEAYEQHLAQGYGIGDSGEEIRNET